MSGRQAEGWLGWEATWGTGQSPPGWGPPGGHPGSLLGAGGPVSSVCITESTAIYPHRANRAAVSGGTPTIFNDFGGWGGFAGWRGSEQRSQRASRPLQGKFQGGEIKGGCKAILTG